MELYTERYLGLSDRGLVLLSEESGLKCLPEVRDAFLELQQDAAKHGFDLQACSAFRSFEAQARIVTAKFKGERKILDINEQPIEHTPEDPIALLNAILLFSAMPGFSRHHIGADLDVYARDRLPEGQSLQLTYHEYLEDSYFNDFGVYLSENISRFGFTNPYMPKISLEGDASTSDKCHELSESIKNEAAAIAKRVASGSIALGPEPWHISHAATANTYLQHFDAEAALQQLEKAELQFSAYVREVMTPERIELMLRAKV